MELEVNNNHKRIELGNLSEPLKRFSIGALGTIIGVSLYGGCLVSEVHASEIPSSSITDINIDNLPDEVRRDVLYTLGKEPYEVITSSDLDLIKHLNIRIYNENDTNLSYLQYFHNLENLYIESFISDTSFLNNLKNVSSLHNLSLFLCNDFGFVSKSDLEFLDSIHLDSISLFGYSLSPGCEDELNNVDDITLGYGYYDIDFSKLTSIDNLKFYKDGIYNIAVYLDSDSYNKLVSSGVNVFFNSEDDRDNFININRRLDSIVSSLNINENCTDQEKFDSILIYVLEHLEYDENISEMIRILGIENVVGADDFYEGGLLYGALEKDSAICGNYAALVEALLNRVGYKRDSSIITNDIHAWNAVKVDGEVYFVDATWLDGQVFNEAITNEVWKDDGQLIVTFDIDSHDAIDLIKSGEGHKLKWYFEDINEIDMDRLDPEGVHSEYTIPEYMFTDYNDDVFENDINLTLNYENIDDEIPEIGDKTFKIKIGKKEFIIGAGALVGILSALGCVVGVHNNREREKRKKRMQNRYNVYEDFNSYERRY